MASQGEKVYIVVGKDMQQGSGAIRWSLSYWSKQPVSFVILQVSIKAKDFVHTPIGILPISSANKEMLEVFRAKDRESADNISKKYLALCPKAKAEVMKIEIFDEPLDKIIISLISDLQIKKLVMNAMATKSLSRKLKYDIHVAHAVYKLKPEHCQLYVVCREKLLFFKLDSNGGEYVEDENGIMVADLRKEKGGLKGLLGRIFTDDASSSNTTNRYSPQVSQNSNGFKDQYEEVEKYISYLQTLYRKQGEEEDEDNICSSQCLSRDNMTHTKREGLRSCPGREVLEAKIKEAQKMAEEKHKRVKAEAERRSKADWGISICNQKAGEIEAQLNEEVAKRNHLMEELDVVRRQVSELSEEIMGSKQKLKEEHQHENELKMKLEEFTLEKSSIEERLGSALWEKDELERRMELVRRKRDALRRKFERCRERELSQMWQLYCREFTADDISEATGDFSEDMQIVVAGGGGGIVYKAKIYHIDVAIKFSTEMSTMSSEEFKAQVDLLSGIRHPNLLQVIGACEERRCVLFEFAHQGSVSDALFSASSAAPPLPWYARIRVAAEVSSALGFLHSAGSAHGRLRASRVLLDSCLSAKLAGLRPSSAASVTNDIAALGELILQLLTGREATSAEEVRRATECGGGRNLEGLVDPTAGNWPMDLAVEFGEIGLELRCAGAGYDQELMVDIVRWLEGLKERAVEMRRRNALKEERQNKELLPPPEAPSAFFCPILQEVMNEPHVAADGFSYELEAIRAWLDSGHDTSPMTNLKLKHTRLTPNHTLRSLIREWYGKTVSF